MNGSGCKTCPVKNCETMNYRGSACAAQRAKLGLGDPMTNGDRIRAMTDEELAEVIKDGISSDVCDYCKHNNLHCSGSPCKNKADAEIITEWLQQPAKEG